VILAMLVIIASFLGLFIWFAIVFLTWGGVNGILCSWLWDFDVKQHWTSLVGHGFVLFLILLIVGLPVTALLQFLTVGISPEIYIPIRIVLLSIFDGIIGRAIGEMFEDSDLLTRRYATSSGSVVSRWRQIPTPEPCPFCGAEFPYRYKDVSPEGKAHCRRCHAIIHDPKHTVGNSSIHREE
ncbi:MAG: hypothetical protein ACFFFK_12530, partial [Candidatus Thorarchaeota archaeon]